MDAVGLLSSVISSDSAVSLVPCSVLIGLLDDGDLHSPVVGDSMLLSGGNPDSATLRPRWLRTLWAVLNVLT